MVSELTYLETILFIILGFYSLQVFASYKRKSILMKMQVHVSRPPVPYAVLDEVRQAEDVYYAELPRHKRIIKQAQDILSLLFPRLIYKINSSVGLYRIKAQTTLGLIDYSIENEYLILNFRRNKKYRQLLPYFAIQPSISEVIASVLLHKLKEEHPMLKNVSWDKIANDRLLICKLYSGYMGAGGDWESWRLNITPGKVAKHRFYL